MGSIDSRMALPAICYEADLYERYGRSSHIRLVMAKVGNNYVIKSTSYGVGPRPEFRMVDKPVRNGFEKSAFDEELVALEQKNYEVYWIKERATNALSFQQLRAKTIPSASVDTASPFGKAFIPNILAQKIRGGVRVTVVIDPLGEVAMYDPHLSNSFERRVEPAAQTRLFLRAGLTSEHSFSCVIEGFYSDNYGLQVTDAAVLHGDDVSNRSFPDRLDMIFAIWGSLSGELDMTDKVIMPEPATRDKLRKVAGKDTHNPVYLLRSPTSQSALLNESVNIETLVVDYEPSVISMLITNGHSLTGITIDGNEFKAKLPSKLIKYEMDRRDVVGMHTPAKLLTIL